MSKLNLDRQTLAKFLPNPEAIRVFERMFSEIDGFPSSIEEANALAAQALATAAQALSMLAEAAAALEQLATAPAPQLPLDPDDTAPRAQLGTISPQNHDAVEITGGTIGLDAGTVAAPSFYLGGDRTTGLYRIAADNWGLSVAGAKLADFSAAAAAFTQNLSTTKQLVSSVAAGTPPLVVTSTTRVANLNVDRAGSADSAGTANSLTSPHSFPADATDLASACALANALKSAALSKGL